MMPKRRIAIMISVVMMGRRMKMAAIFMEGTSVALRFVFELDLDSGNEAKLAIRDDRLAGRQALRDHGFFTERPCHLHRARFGGHIRGHDENEIAGLSRLNGLRGNHD